MSEQTSPSGENGTNREAAWARPVGRLTVAGLPAEAVNLNVEGRRLTGPVKGFGQMWQKTYQVNLGTAAKPAEVVTAWKENFPKFWPKGNHFYGPLTGMKPGEVAVLNLAGPGGLTGPGGAPVISTGVMVIYADDLSFSFMTPEGHILAGMITFSAHEEDDGTTVAQVQVLIRANDPLYELTFRLGVGHKSEDEFWQYTLRGLASHFGMNAQVVQRTVLVDPRVQWSEAKNIWHNAGIRTGIYMMMAPFRWLRALGGRR